MISVVLIQPENAGNIGAIARCMANFGQGSLILIDPKADHLSEEARNRAKHARAVLEGACVKGYGYFIKGEKGSIFEDFESVIALTSVMGTDYNILRTPVSPERLSRLIKDNRRYALVFGRESTGLTNEEIERCDLTVTIDTSRDYPALNLSHAVAVVLYEIYKMHGKRKITSHILPADPKTKDVLLMKIDEVIDNTEFSTEEKRHTQKKVWKRLFGKAMLSKRESYAIIGFLNKLSGKKD